MRLHPSIHLSTFTLCLFIILSGCDSGGNTTDDSSVPGEDSSVPGEDSSTPGDDSSTPGDDSSIPGGDSSTPGEDSSTPGEDSSIPDAPCDCGTWVCGTTPEGCSCGSCPIGQLCDEGQCVAEPGNQGSYCGSTMSCPGWVTNPATGEKTANPNYADCINTQCTTQTCLGGGIPGVYLNVPVCTLPCQIYTDDFNNKTGAPGADGVEDANAPVTDCTGFLDGPGGTNYVCVSFSSPTEPNPVALCAPGSTFHYCESDADCVAGEQCTFTTINGELADRCIARVKPTAEVSTAKMTEACDARDQSPTFCESGLCFGIGCVSYCADDSHCDTTKILPNTGCDTTAGTCKGWPTKSCSQDLDCSYWECGLLDAEIFSDAPQYKANLCWPKTGCEKDADCPDTYYCRYSWNGEIDAQTGLPTWANICEPQQLGGADLGQPCGGSTGTTCKNDALCLGGFCSALCDEDTDCGTDQLCTVLESSVDLDGDGKSDQSLPIEVCTMHKGSRSACFSEADCSTGERCDLIVVENRIDDPANPGTMILDPDGPYVAKGLCLTTSTSLAQLGEACSSGAECISGWCLGASQTSAGYCSAMCQNASECGGTTLSDGTVLGGLCNNYLYAWGGDVNAPSTNIYIGLCSFTTGSGDDCSSTLTCSTDEYCGVIPITFGPDYAAQNSYVCIDATNADGSTPTLAEGDACDPNAEDAQGNRITQCLSGYCFPDVQDGTGYCSALCAPGNVACSNPMLSCLPVTTIMREGKYAANAGTWNACLKDIECTPCSHSGECPGDRVCVNLGQDSDTLADYRCVDACSGSGDCASSGAPVCNAGFDGYGQPVMGCFELGATFPINHCTP